MWASDGGEAEPSDQDEGEEEEAEGEEGTAQAAGEAERHQQGTEPLPEDEVPGQRAPPGRRRSLSAHLHPCSSKQPANTQITFAERTAGFRTAWQSLWTTRWCLSCMDVVAGRCQ